jgi:hypothetical protein
MLYKEKNYYLKIFIPKKSASVKALDRTTIVECRLERVRPHFSTTNVKKFKIIKKIEASSTLEFFYSVTHGLTKNIKI